MTSKSSSLRCAFSFSILDRAERLLSTSLIKRLLQQFESYQWHFPEFKVQIKKTGLGSLIIFFFNVRVA